LAAPLYVFSLYFFCFAFAIVTPHEKAPDGLLVFMGLGCRLSRPNCVC
jgi:hypothetical protein